MKKLLTTALIAIAPLALTACAGFQPLHGNAATQAILSDMSLNMGEGKDEADRAVGYMIRQALRDRIRFDATPQYQLVVNPEVTRIGLGLTGDDFASRFDSRVQADWTLFRTADGATLAQGRATSLATYSAQQDPYLLQTAADAANERGARAVADEVLQQVALELSKAAAAAAG